MAMGHAAGVAAALAVEKGGEVRDVAPGLVQDRLRADGAILEL